MVLLMNTDKGIFQDLGHTYNNGDYKNVSIICEDGVNVETNSLLLSSISPWLYTLIQEQSNQDEIIIIAPDIQSKNVNNLMRIVEINLFNDTSIEPIVNRNTLEILLKPNFDSILPFCKVFSLSMKYEGEKLAEKNNVENENVQNKNNSEKENVHDKNISEKEIVQDKNNFEKDNVQNILMIKSDPDDLLESNNSLISKRENVQDKNNSEKENVENILMSKSDPDDLLESNETNISSYVVQVMSATHSTNPKLKSKAIQKIKVGKYSVSKTKLCSFCGKTFEKENNADMKKYHKHILKHKVDNFSCECNDTFENNAQKERHMKVKHKRSRGKYSVPKTKLCSFCGKTFVRENNEDMKQYQKHILKHRVDEFSCECEETFESNAQKERHMKVKHLGFIQCSKCLLTFKQSNLLDLHFKKTHTNLLTPHIEQKQSQENNSPVLCSLCGKSYRIKRDLNHHMKYMHSKMVVKCDDCGKEIAGPYKLNEHKRYEHTNKQCPVCGLIFNRLKAHMNSVHKDDKDKKHVCDVCEKGFMQKGKLESHKMSVHIKTDHSIVDMAVILPIMMSATEILMKKRSMGDFMMNS